MPKLVWDLSSERLYEIGVDHGVLYPKKDEETNGAFTGGVVFNGLTAFTVTPTGAEPNAQYGDNIKYLELSGPEEMGATIESFSSPTEFDKCDGSAEPVKGLGVSQQGRKRFGFVARTKLGSDDNPQLGYIIHLLYNCRAGVSQRAYSTITNTPEAIKLSWDVTTTPIPFEDEALKLMPTSYLKVNSTALDPAKLTELEGILFGTDTLEPRLPSPQEIITLLSSSSGGQGTQG